MSSVQKVVQGETRKGDIMNNEKLKNLIYEQVPEDLEYHRKSRRNSYIRENKTLLYVAILTSVMCLNYHMAELILTGGPIFGLLLGFMLFMCGCLYKSDVNREDELLLDGVIEAFELRRDSLCWYLICVINMSSLLSIVAIRGKLLLYYDQPGMDQMSAETMGGAVLLLSILPAFVNFDVRKMFLHILMVTPMFLVCAAILESSGDLRQISHDMWVIYRFVTIGLAIIGVSIIMKRRKIENNMKQ